MLSANYSGTALSLAQDGTSYSTSISGSIDYGDSSRKDLAIGVGSANWFYQHLPGKIAEVLIYNRSLTSTEQQQAEVYLADKYGVYHPYATWPSAYSSAVQSEITRNQWNKSQADAYVAFVATSPAVPTAGLVTWLKADTGVTSSSGKVSQWADQSPAGNNAVQSSGTNQPTLVSSAINGNPALSFDGSSSYMSVADNSSLRSSDVTIIAVSTLSGAGDYSQIVSKPYANSVWNSPYQSYGLWYAPTTEPYGVSAISGTEEYVGGSTVNLGQAHTLSANYSGTTLSLAMDGISYSTSISGSIDYGDNSRKDLAIGVGSTNWLYQHLPGQIAEVLIYNRSLTSTERQQAEEYLASKYGLYYNAAPTISPNGGSYSSSHSFTITTPLTVGAIHYTLDGTEPTASSPTYSSAITLTGSALVSAEVFSSTGDSLSPVGSAQFYINDTGSTGLPTAATSLSVTAASSHELDLAWTLSGQLNYYGVGIYRSSDGGTTYDFVAMLDPSATSYSDTSVVTGTSYKYIVGTLNTSGESDTSASSSVSPSTITPMTVTVSSPSGATPLP